jgi:hypothetical protein
MCSALAGALAAGLLLLMRTGIVACEWRVLWSVTLAGGAMGALFGRLTRRILRTLPRIAFTALLASAVWLLVYAFVLARLAPELTTSVPFVRSTWYVVAYGVLVGVIPPVGVRRESGDEI